MEKAMRNEHLQRLMVMVILTERQMVKQSLQRLMVKQTVKYFLLLMGLRLEKQMRLEIGKVKHLDLLKLKDFVKDLLKEIRMQRVIQMLMETGKVKLKEKEIDLVMLRVKLKPKEIDLVMLRVILMD